MPETLEEKKFRMREFIEVDYEASLTGELEERMKAHTAFNATDQCFTIEEFISRYSPMVKEDVAYLCGCGEVHKRSERCGPF